MSTKRTDFALWQAQQPVDGRSLEHAPSPVPAPIPLDAGQRDRQEALREMRELGHGAGNG